MSEHPPPPTPSNAHLGRRLGARILDGAILFIPVVVVGSVIGSGYRIGDGNTGGRQFLATLAGLLITFGYFVVMEAERGGTLGKRALHLTVEQVDSPGTRITAAQAAKRNAFQLLSAVPTVLGGLLSLAAAIGIATTANKSPLGQGFHDRWAGARVRYEP
jgi:uncharacterized RDD family membrane protein YckC